MLKFAGLLVLAAGLSSAGTVTFITPSGSNSANDGPVSAKATFVTSAGQLVITLEDLLANPTSAGQLLSDLEFTFGNTVTGVFTMTSSGQEISIAGGVGTTGATGSTGWGFGTLSSDSSTKIICIICGDSGETNLTTPRSGQPSHTIIGPGPYTNAMGSIDGNGPHNPFVNQVGTFTILNASITADTTISSATFSFGTTFGDDVDGCVQGSRTCGGSTIQATPEPFSMCLMGAGLLSVGLIKKFRRTILG